VQAAPGVAAIVTLPNVPPRLLQVLGGLGLTGIFHRVVRDRRGRQSRLHGLDTAPRYALILLRGLPPLRLRIVPVPTVATATLVGRHDSAIIAQIGLVDPDVAAVLPDVPIIGSNVRAVLCDVAALRSNVALILRNLRLIAWSPTGRALRVLWDET
jgi:hypothetical protein